MMGEILALIPTYQPEDPTAGLHIYDESISGSMKPWVGKVKVLLLDGVEVQLLQKEHSRLIFGITGCDHSKWQKEQPEEAGYPESILKTLQKLPWEFGNTFTLVRKDGLVVFSFTDRSFTYRPHPYAMVSVRTSSQYNIVVEGAEGCTYILKSAPGLCRKISRFD